MKKYIIGLIFLLLISCSNTEKTFSSSCDNPKIKGNLTTYNGENIYHMPGGQYYEITDAEEMFCTEEEAEKAGYRRSKR